MLVIKRCTRRVQSIGERAAKGLLPGEGVLDKPHATDILQISNASAALAPCSCASALFDSLAWAVGFRYALEACPACKLHGAGFENTSVN